MPLKSFLLSHLSIFCINVFSPNIFFKQEKTDSAIHLNPYPILFFYSLGSDITLHFLIKNFNEGKDLNNKSLFVNDLTLLFSTKDHRTKIRLINGLAELLSDGIYEYGSRLSRGFERLECRVNVVANITLESYLRNKRELIENTFGERVLKIFYHVPLEKFKKNFY